MCRRHLLVVTLIENCILLMYRVIFLKLCLMPLFWILPVIFRKLELVFPFCSCFSTLQIGPVRGAFQPRDQHMLNPRVMAVGFCHVINFQHWYNLDWGFKLWMKYLRIIKIWKINESTACLRFIKRKEFTASFDLLAYLSVSFKVHRLFIKAVHWDFQYRLQPICSS